MPRPPSVTRRTTLYSLRHPGELVGCIASKYRDDENFLLAPVVVADVAGLLVTGSIEREQADWCAVVTGYTEQAVSLGNRNALAVLLLPLGKRVFALAYGLGFLVLDQSLVE